MAADFTYNTNDNNKVSITGTGGEDNLNFTMSYGGYEDTYTYTSDIKNGSYTGTIKEDICLGNTQHILTNSSKHVEGIDEKVANVSVLMVGDRYYQDAESAKAFVENISAYSALKSSPGHNDHAFDLSDLIPINFTDIANRVASVTATPDDLEAMPPADTIYNLPKAIAIATENQIKIEMETVTKQLKMLPLAQLESNDVQNEETVKELREDEEDEGIISQILGFLGSLMGSFTPETKPKDSYSITDDMLYSGLEDWIEHGGINIERKI